MIRTLLLFLYATGLRVGEALNLTQGDVDLRAGFVSVRESKFFKSRLVPLGPQLVKALANYVARCEGAGFPQVATLLSSLHEEESVLARHASSKFPPHPKARRHPSR